MHGAQAEGEDAATAKKKLKKAGCKLGKVTGDGAKVTGQSPKKGKILPSGKKVNVKLG